MTHDDLLRLAKTPEGQEALVRLYEHECAVVRPLGSNKHWANHINEIKRAKDDFTDLLTHWIDVIQWYMGQPAPKTVTTAAQRYIFKEWDCPDAATTAIEFPGDFTVTFTGAYNSSIDDGGIEFRGSEATLKIDRGHLALYSEGQKWEPGTMAPEPEIFVRSERDGTIDHVKNFLDCVRSRKTPTAPVQIGFEAARTGWLANIALERGKRIVFDASNNNIL